MDDRSFQLLMDKLGDMDKRFDKMDDRFDRIDEKVEKIREWKWLSKGAFIVIGALISYVVEVWANK